MEDGGTSSLELSLGLSVGGGSSEKLRSRDPASVLKAREDGDSIGGVAATDDRHATILQPADGNFLKEIRKSPISRTDSSGDAQCSPSRMNIAGCHNALVGPIKRKLISEDRSGQKKPQVIIDLDEVPRSSTRNINVSVNTADGSTGENEDIVESEAEGSNSWTERFPDGVDCHGQRPLLRNESSSNLGKKTPNFQTAFGYPAFQLPVLQTTTSWMLASRPPLISIDDSKKTIIGISEGSSKGTERLGHPTAGPTTKGDDNGRTNIGETPTPLISYTAIRPGILADVKFGGTGSYPDLPWVSTTGSGPAGRTISGVTYKCTEETVRIVCACHGLHMSPEEFVKHANAATTRPETALT